MSHLHLVLPYGVCSWFSYGSWRTQMFTRCLRRSIRRLLPKEWSYHSWFERTYFDRRLSSLWGELGRYLPSYVALLLSYTPSRIRQFCRCWVLPIQLCHPRWYPPFLQEHSRCNCGLRKPFCEPLHHCLPGKLEIHRKGDFRDSGSEGLQTLWWFPHFQAKLRNFP